MKDINLLPDDIRSTEDQFKTESSSRSPVKVATIVIAAVVLVAVTFILPKVWIMTLNTQLDMTKKSIESATYNEVKAITSNMSKLEEKIKAKNEILTVIDNDTVSIAQILNIINVSTPKGCELTRVEFADNKLLVEGKVPDGNKASSLLANIRRINFLSVSDTSVTTKDGNYNFRYTFTFGGKDGN